MTTPTNPAALPGLHVSISLRDVFAGLVAAGAANTTGTHALRGPRSFAELAVDAYALADALLTARERRT